MEHFEDDRLIAELRELRPAPRPEFAAELDERAAAGFPRRSRLAALRGWLQGLTPRRALLPAGAVGLAAIVAATVVVAGSESDSEPTESLRSLAAPAKEPASPGPEVGTAAAEPPAASSAPSGGETSSAASPEVEIVPPAPPESAWGNSVNESAAPLPSRGVAAQAPNRDVERSAELVLGTDPAGVADASADVFGVVHSHRGIVLSSSTREGGNGEAGAEFELLIPSARLGDALAALSSIAEVRSRQEATTDITAPTVGVSEHLQDSRARIDSLLGQLAEADTEAEREAVEVELRGERRRAAFLRSRLADLQRRANFARVSLTIETGAEPAGSEAGGSWSIDDALGDAGRILAVAAGVALIGLAILAPIALIALLAWLAQRTWVRRGRRRALG